MITFRVLLCALLLASATGGAGEPAAERFVASWQDSARWWKTRPIRRDYPLRTENISDEEVREIQQIMKERYPGSIVYISAVTTRCPCEDGPDCADQVWSVATHRDEINELALSRIGGEWQIGPLQEWWLVYDRLGRLYRGSTDLAGDGPKIDYEEYQARLWTLIEAFPRCRLDSSRRGFRAVEPVSTPQSNDTTLTAQDRATQ